MNNNTSRLFIFIGIAILVVLVMYFMSPQGSGKIVDLNKPGPVKDFKALCDSMQGFAWNSGKYEELKGRLESLKSQEVIGLSDGLVLEEYLDLTYAQNLQKACKEWMDTDGNSADIQLLQAMNSISLNTKCMAIVSKEIDLMQSYFAAFQLPGRVQSFIQQKFNQGTYNQLVNDINKFCSKSGISHFNKLKAIRNQQKSQIDAFKIFADAYESRMIYYNNNSDDIDAKDYLREYCPGNNSEIRKYIYYLGDIQSTPGICN